MLIHWSDFKTTRDFDFYLLLFSSMYNKQKFFYFIEFGILMIL